MMREIHPRCPIRLRIIPYTFPLSPILLVFHLAYPVTISLMMRRAFYWLWRRFCLLAVGIALLCCLPGVVAAQPAMLRPAFSFAPAPELSGGPPTPAEQARAHRHARQGRLLLLGSLLYEAALLVGVLLLGVTRWLARVTAPVSGWIPALAVVFGILTLGSFLLTLPLDYYAGFIFPHQYGLSNQTPLAWLREHLLASGIGILTGFPLILLFYGLLRRAPHTWWLWTAAASAPVSLFLLLIEPVFIAPLFNKFTPLRDPELRREILAMAHKQGIPANEVFQMDASRQSNAVNAYVNGIGPTQRIVLYDTLLKYFSPDEIKFIMAHEMGHYVLGHIRLGILVSIAGTLVGGFVLYLASGLLLRRWGAQLAVHSLAEPAAYPLLLALGMALSLLAMPLANAFSRHLERQADRFAVHVYPHPAASISAFHKLARLNVAEENPPRWAEILLASHPSISERIEALKKAEVE